jgi:hypothetical protein
MICKSCQQGADYVSGGGGTLANAHYFHRMCQGSTRCDCQHRVEAQAEGKSVQR